MTTEVTTAKDFQERMFERIRSQMGDLMTNEELKKIVDAAIQKAFFAPSIIIENHGRYDQRERTGPPPIVALIEGLIRDQIKELIKEWLEVHSEEVIKVFKDRLDAGIIGAVTGAINAMMNDRFFSFNNDLQNMIRNMPK